MNKFIKRKIQETSTTFSAAKFALLFSFRASPINTLGYIFFDIMENMSNVALVWVFKLITDHLIKIKIGSGDVKTLYLYLLILFVMSFIKIISGISSGYFNVRSYRLINRKIKYVIDSKIAELDMEDHDNAKTYDLIQRVRDTYDYSLNLFLQNTVTLITDIISIIGVTAALYSTTGNTLFFTALLLLPETISNLVFGKKYWGISNSTAEVRRNYLDTLMAVHNSKKLVELKVYQNKKYLLDKAYNSYDVYNDSVIGYEKRRLLVLSLCAILTSLGIILPIVYFVNTTLATGKMEYGSIVFLFGSLTTFNMLYARSSRALAKMYEVNLSVADIIQLLGLRKKIVSGTKLVDLSSIRIEFRNVSFKYPSSKSYVFKDLTFTIKPEEKIAIVGENGAGKSTFVKLLCRIYDVSSGEILINSVNIKDLDISEYYKHISILNQDFSTFHFDVNTNIGLGNVDDIGNKTRIRDSAIRARADEFIQKYKFKYNQVLSRHYPEGIEPSYGQWQKIAIARALFRNPEILILDEPTSAIDPVAEFEIFQNLYQYTKDKSLIIISHRFSTVKNADRILVMDSGKIVESGSHKELMSIGGKYAEAYKIQKESLTKGDE